MKYSFKTKGKLLLGALMSWFVFFTSVILIIVMLSTGLLLNGFSQTWGSYVKTHLYEDAYDALHGYCWDYLFSEESGYSFDTYYYDSKYGTDNSNFRFSCISDDESAIPGFYYTDEKKQFVKEYEFQLEYYKQSGVRNYFFTTYEGAISYINTLPDNTNYSLYEDNEQYTVSVTYDDSIKKDITMQVYLAQGLSAKDHYFYANTTLRMLDDAKAYIIIASIASLIALAIFSIKLCHRAGIKEEGGSVSLSTLDKVPFDLFTALFGGALVFTLLITEDILGAFPDRLIEFAIMFVFLLVSSSITGLLTLGYLISTSVRIKHGSVFTNTILVKAFMALRSMFTKIVKAVSNIASYKKVAIVFLIFDGILTLIMLFSAIAIDGLYYSESFILLIIFCMFMLALIVFEACVVYAVYLFQSSCEKIANGDLEHKIENKFLLKLFGPIVDSINNISEGMNLALKDRIKSEHFKTELITNVSHDIKTPLTSIITYVNLLQNTQVSGDEATEYLDVLERQSEKLKKLIEDLVEASKASTGNLNLDYSVMDIGMMVEQAVAEYEGRFQASGLNVVFDKPETAFVMADGRHLWRIFDNLLSNVCKYSLENTRVYITVLIVDEKCIITFKNISKYEIKITPEELTERFVRGDKSRNTEGSGLGLSIARSLTEAMGGKLFVEVDGDLYKASVIFDSVSPEQEQLL